MKHPFDLSGRKALITGAGAENGIGFCAAQMLAELGAEVFLTGQSERVLDRAAQLRSAGFPAHALAADLTNEAQVAHLITQVEAQLSGLDILVNNAGMTSVQAPMETTGENSSLAAMTTQAWHAAFDRNVTTAFYVTRSALPLLRASSAGRIIMVASVTGAVMAMRNDAAYAMSKAALVGLTKATALDEASNAITVNAIAPGWIATDSQTENEIRQGKLTPMGRSAHPNEIANAIAWLASMGASYVTGQVIVVDGGNSIAEERA